MTIRTPTEAPELITFTAVELRLPKKFKLSPARRRQIGGAAGGRIGRLRKGQGWRSVTLPVTHGFLADLLVEEVGRAVTVVALGVRLRGKECFLPTDFSLYVMAPGTPVVGHMARVLETRVGTYAKRFGELHVLGMPGTRQPMDGKCEKCGTRTHWTIGVADRMAYWCGCANESK